MLNQPSRSTDVFAALPRFTWRGQTLPVMSRSVRFSHDDTDHTFQFRDGDFIERKGVKNWTFSYSIPFRQDIAKGPYTNLFTEELKKFIASCRNRSPDRLVDPVIGSFRAVCSTYEEETDVLKRDGTDVRVEFREAPDLTADTLPEIDGLTSLYMIAGQSGALDAQAERHPFPTQLPSAKPSADILSAINGFGRQIQNTGNKISAALDGLAYKAEQLEETVSLLQDPRTFQLARSSRRVQVAVLKAKERISNPGRSLVTVTLAYTKSISAIARDASMTVAQLLLLNPTIAGRPLVKPGTKISIYKSKRAELGR